MIAFQNAKNQWILYYFDDLLKVKLFHQSAWRKYSWL